MKRCFVLLLGILLCCSLGFASSVNLSDIAMDVQSCVGWPSCQATGSLTSAGLSDFGGLWNLSESDNTITATLLADFDTTAPTSAQLRFTLPVGAYIPDGGCSLASSDGIVAGGCGSSVFFLNWYNQFVPSGTSYTIALRLDDQAPQVPVPEPSSLTLFGIGVIGLLRSRPISRLRRF